MPQEDGRRGDRGRSRAPPSSGTGPVPPLSGIASTVFDDHMTPYVALEERSMANQLRAAASDNTVDARGERPSSSRRRTSPYMKEQHAPMHGPTEGEDVLPSSARLLEESARLLEGSGEDVAPARRSGRGEVGARRGGRRRLVVDTGRRGCYRLQRNRHVREALEDLVLDKIGDKFSFGRIRQTTSTN